MTVIKRIALLTFFVLIMLPIHLTIAAPVDRPLMQPPNTYKSVDGSSEGHTSDLAAGTPADPFPLAIGEVITYRLVVELPEGTSPDVQFHDTLAFNIEYISGSARVSYSANNAFTGTGTVGINEINPTTAIPGGLISFGITGPRELTFDLGEIINNDNDANTELLIIEYRALVVNTSDNVAGATFANNFSIDLNNDGTDENLSNDVNHVIVEPNITITKTINTTLSNPTGTTIFDGGDTVVYDVVITNPASANGATAFDLNLIDNIDPDINLIDVDFIGAPAYSSPADNSDYVMPVQTVNVSIGELRQGDAITVRVTVVVRSSVTLGQIIPNTANLTWTSLPGANGTANATPGTSGDTNGERNGDGTGENDYTRNSNETISIGGTVNTYKSVDGSSEGHTSDLAAGTPADPFPLAIGEVITYRLVVELPEGTSPDVQFHDTLAFNIEYISGSARVSYSANNAFTGTGTVGINEINPTTAIPGGLISFGITGPRELTFDLGEIINNDNDVNTELLIIEYRALVVNTSDNVAGATFVNNFSVDLNNDGTDEDLSNDVNHVIVEPNITITKTINTTLSNPTGTTVFNVFDTVVYDVVITNPTSANGATAFDLNLIDNIDPNLDLIDVNFIGAPAYSSPADNSDYVMPVQTVNVSIGELRQGDSITVRVTVTVMPSVTAGQIISNTANLTWTSLPGANGTANATPGTSGNTNGERNGNGTGENDYINTANTSFSIFDGLPIKRIAGTSNSATSDSTADTLADPRPVLIGETITYRLEAVLPESTSISFTLEDVLPVGLDFVAGSARVSYSTNNSSPTFGDAAFSGIQNEVTPTFAFPAGNISFPVAGTIRFNFGSIINNDGDSDTEFIYLEFDVLVLNNLDNMNGGIKINNFDVVIDEGFPTEVITTSNDVYAVTLIPTLLVSKDDSQDPVAAGALMNYTVTIENSGTPNLDATNVILTDVLPASFVMTSATPSQGTCAPLVGTTLTCDLGTIASGASATVIITGNYPATTPSGTIANNIAYVTSAEGIDGNDGNDTPTDNDDARAEEPTTILRQVDVAISKTVDNPLPDEGDTITYSIEISNNGPSQATNVIMTDTIPAGMIFTSFAPISAPCVYAAPTLTCTYPIMDVGQIETLQIVATVDSGTSGTLITNIASANSTEPEINLGDNSDFVNVAVNGIDLSVSKTISTTAPQVGDFIVYTVTVRNDGAVDATGVELTDTLPSTVTYSGVYTASQGTFDGSVWTLADPIPPNGSAELLITVQVTSSVGTFVNIAEITAADQPDGDSTPNNGVTTEDDYAESVFIFDPPFGRKTFNDAGLPELEWTIVWVNPNGDPVDVTISDPLLAGTTFVAGSLTCTSPGTLTVNNCDYDTLNNEIVFDGTIFPDFGATPATIDSAINRLIITYRVNVPDSVDTVFNEATLSNTNGDVVVSETFIRQPVTVTEEPPVPTDPPPTTSSTDLALLASAKALPATGETPIWRDAAWILGAVVLGMMLMGGIVYRRRVNH